MPAGRGHRPRRQRGNPTRPLNRRLPNSLGPTGTRKNTTAKKMLQFSVSSCSSWTSWLNYRLATLLIAVPTIASAEIHPSDCVRAAKYSEGKRGVSMLVMQNGHTIFEHYANGGSARGRWPIFSGTKSFWGIAALAAVRDGLFKLDDPVSDTITEWKSDSRKSQITIRQLLNQTDGIEGASRLQRASIRDRNAMGIRLLIIAGPRSTFIYGPSHLQIFSELLRRKLKGRAVISYLEGRVSNRLGLGRLNYKKDARGNPLPAPGFELTAGECGRLGDLVLGRGNYHGRLVVTVSLLRCALAGSAA